MKLNLLWQMSHVARKPVMSYANNKGADQPANPHSLINTFVVRCLDSIIPPVWIHYSKENPSCSTFRVITANFRASEILGFLVILFIVKVSVCHL